MLRENDLISLSLIFHIVVLSLLIQLGKDINSWSNLVSYLYNLWHLDKICNFGRAGREVKAMREDFPPDKEEAI